MNELSEQNETKNDQALSGQVEPVVSKPDLKGFADEILEVFFDAGSIDAFDIQEIAEERGLLKKTIVTESCGESCRCVEETDFPCECYRKAY